MLTSSRFWFNHILFKLIRTCYIQLEATRLSESESEEYVEETNTGFYSTAVECAI